MKAVNLARCMGQAGMCGRSAMKPLVPRTFLSQASSATLHPWFQSSWGDFLLSDGPQRAGVRSRTVPTGRQGCYGQGLRWSTIACTPRSAPPVEPVQTGRSRWVRKETRSSPLPSTRSSLRQGFQRLRLLIPVQTGPVSKTLPPYSYLHGG